jgi:tetratricopeptide (TPR) repeat protein
MSEGIGRRGFLGIAAGGIAAIAGCASSSPAERAEELLVNKDYIRAVPFLDEVLAREPANTDALLRRGWCYFQLNEFEKAVEDYSLALNHKPDDAELHVVRGMAKYAQGLPPRTNLFRVNEGVEDLEKAVVLNPALPDTHAALAFAYHLQGMQNSSQEKIKKCYEHLRKANDAVRKGGKLRFVGQSKFNELYRYVRQQLGIPDDI